MRFPIKLNKNILPNFLHNILPSSFDPRGLEDISNSVSGFAECVSAIKIDNTWKSTTRNRHKYADKFIIENGFLSKEKVFLEIGASAGITSMELIQKMNNTFNKYYVTDLLFRVDAIKTNKATYYYHPVSKEFILMVNKYFLIYNDMEKKLFPFNIILNYIISKKPEYCEDSVKKIDLLHPSIKDLQRNNKKIKITEYNMFGQWKNEKADIVKVANVLNRTYFSDKEICLALHNINEAMNEGGVMILIDNRKIEKVSFFIKNGKNFNLHRSINGGTEIIDLVVQR